jgi:hypothetical protein
MPAIAMRDKLTMLDDLARFQHNPLGYVLYAFPWGSGALKEQTGPREWQRKVLKDIGTSLAAGGDLGAVVQEAIASGHGIGKTALVAWVILWAMSTFDDTRGVVTAGTSTQLETKTWPEVYKWHSMAINAWMFTVTATAIYSTDPKHQKTWRMDAVPWSKENSEAFAGLHNLGKRILVIYDEASVVEDPIWEVTEGALTDAKTEIIWLAFGNPTRNTGRFKECFGRFKHRWRTRNIDSRTVEGATNQDLAAAWVQDYGEDSDFVRVRVRGEFPKAGSLQFISEDVVDRARKAEAVAHMHEPLILGVDVARFGDDQSVIFARRGRDWRTWNNAGGVPGKCWMFRGMPTDQLAARVNSLAAELKADAIFVDGGGVGGGVVDMLRLMHRDCFDVQFGGKATTSASNPTAAVGEKYANKRAEMCSVEYSFNIRDEILLEAKASMKKRGLASPDIADAIALTYSEPIQSLSTARLSGKTQNRSDYDPYEE